MGDDGLTISGPSTVRGAVLMLVIGLAATGYGAYDYTQQSNAVEDAVEVDATITDLDIESTSAGSSTDVSYRPTVRFTYEYEGTAYASTNVFPSTISTNYDTESTARSVVEEYAVDESATAYVDPSDPDAFLKHRTSKCAAARDHDRALLRARRRFVGGQADPWLTGQKERKNRERETAENRNRGPRRRLRSSRSTAAVPASCPCARGSP